MNTNHIQIECITGKERMARARSVSQNVVVRTSGEARIERWVVEKG